MLNLPARLRRRDATDPDVDQPRIGCRSLLVLPGLIGLALVLISIFLIAHGRYPGLPAAWTETGGWHTWADQSRYIDAARAWSRCDFSPARHWYPPGYALLGAFFLPLTPHDRFLLPNLACLVASQFACAALAERMFPENRFARLLGAGAFLIASVGTMPGLKSWLIPWTSTPSATLTFAALVAALRLGERPGVGRAALVGSAIGGVTLFRPGDAVPVALATVVALAPVVLALPVRRAAGIVAVAGLAVVAWTAVTAGVIDATSGFGPGTYYGLSGRQGFEFRLLPVRWVTLVIDARPIFDSVGTERIQASLHHGMAERFPWIIPGIGGIAACWFGGGRKRVHVLLVTWLAIFLALMLSFRDLHILGFWLYGNYHYFKVTQPIFLLYALLLLSRLADRGTRWRSAFAALAAIVVAFGWRASLVTLPVKRPLASGQNIAIPQLNRLNDAAIVPGGGSWNAFYYGEHVLTIGVQRFSSPYDFRLYPRRGDFLLVPVRPLPRGSGVLTVASGVYVEPGAPAFAARQTISFGIPCAFGLAGHMVCGSLGAPLMP